MTKKEMERILTAVRSGAMGVGHALEQMQEMPYKDLEYAKVDYHRELRNGFPEVIYSPGKSLEQIQGIVADMLARTKGNILASRADEQVYAAIRELTEDVVYYKDARSVVVKRQEYPVSEEYIAVVTAGTSDIPVDVYKRQGSNGVDINLGIGELQEHAQQKTGLSAAFGL